MRKFSKEWLFDKYGGSLFGIISRSVMDQTTAENILEKSFRKIFQGLELTSPSKDHLFSWMLQITRDIIHQTIQERQSLGIQCHIPVAETTYEPDGSGSANDHKLLELIYLRGMRSGELSRRFAISIKEVKSCLRRGVRHLRKKIN